MTGGGLNSANPNHESFGSGSLYHLGCENVPLNSRYTNKSYKGWTMKFYFGDD